MKRSMAHAGLMSALLLAVLAAAAVAQQGVTGLYGTVTLQDGTKLTGDIKLADFSVIYGSGIGELHEDLGALKLRVGDEDVVIPGRDVWTVDAEWVNEGTEAAPKWIIKQVTVLRKDRTRVVGQPTWLLMATTAHVAVDKDQTRRVHAFPLAQKEFSPGKFIKRIVIGQEPPPELLAAVPTTPTETPAAPAPTVAPAGTPAVPAETPAASATTPAEVPAAPTEIAAVPAEAPAETPAVPAETPATPAATPAEAPAAPTEIAAVPAEAPVETPAVPAETPATPAATPAEAPAVPAEAPAVPAQPSIPPVPVKCTLTFLHLTSPAEVDRVKAILAAAAIEGQVDAAPNKDGSVTMAFALPDVTLYPSLVEQFRYKSSGGGRTLVFEETAREISSYFRTVEIKGALKVTVTFTITPGAKLFYSPAPGEEIEVSADRIDAEGNVTMPVTVTRGASFVYARSLLGELSRAIKIDIFSGEVIEISAADYQAHR